MAQPMGMDNAAHYSLLVERLGRGERLMVDSLEFALMKLGNPWQLDNGDRVIIDKDTTWGTLRAIPVEKYLYMIVGTGASATRAVVAALIQVDPTLVVTAVNGWYDRYTIRRAE